MLATFRRKAENDRVCEPTSARRAQATNCAWVMSCVVLKQHRLCVTAMKLLFPPLPRASAAVGWATHRRYKLQCVIRLDDVHPAILLPAGIVGLLANRI